MSGDYIRQNYVSLHRILILDNDDRTQTQRGH